jgi:hypothetical protein
MDVDCVGLTWGREHIPWVQFRRDPARTVSHDQSGYTTLLQLINSRVWLPQYQWAREGALLVN